MMKLRLFSKITVSEIDRNARAYGWEIGRGQQLAEEIDSSDDNPFLDPDWRNKCRSTT